MTAFHTCGPNEALVVSGCGHRRPLIIPGGRVFVWPLIQKVQRISLNAMCLTIESSRVHSRHGVVISMMGTAVVKIPGHSPDMLSAACEHFLDKSEPQIMDAISETLDGHQRAVIASMSVDQIHTNLKNFTDKVSDGAASDLAHMGFVIISYTIKAITDGDGYLKALGLTRAAQVKRDGRVAEAEAVRDALIGKALAEQELMSARYANATQIAKSRADCELKKAAFDEKVCAMMAVSDLSYDLQTAKTRQPIKAEQMEVKLVEKLQQIREQELDVVRRERELKATVRLPAEAEKYRLERLADAHRNHMIMSAEGEAEAIRLRAEAEAVVIEDKAMAQLMARKAILDTLPKIGINSGVPLTPLCPQLPVDPKDNVLVTHKTSVLPEVDKIIVLKEGLISEFGSFDELIAKRGDFAELVAEYVLRQESCESVRHVSTTAHNNCHKMCGTGDQTQDIQQNERKLIKEDKPEAGSVNTHIYKKCFRLVGVQYLIVILMSYIIGIASGLWLSEWSADALIPKLTDYRSLSLILRLCLLFVFICGFMEMVFISSALLSISQGCVDAAKRLYGFWTTDSSLSLNSF